MPMAGTKQPRKISKDDRTIASCTAEVAWLKQCDVEKTEQIATLRQDYAKLQKDSSSCVAELQKRCDAQSKQLDSVWNQLRGSKGCVEEKECAIGVLNAEVKKWKCLDAIKNEQLDGKRQDKEKLRQALAALSSQTAECCDALSKEIVSLRADLQTKVADQLKLTCSKKTEEFADANSCIRESTLTVQFTELQGCYMTQSKELDSVSDQLQTLTLSNQKKDCDISCLSAERDRQFSANTRKVELTTTLQRELSASNSQLVELQDRCKALSDELQICLSSNEDKDRRVAALTNEVSELRRMQGDEKVSPTAEVKEQVESYVQYGVVCSQPINTNNMEHIRRKHMWERDPTGDYCVPGGFKSTLCKVGFLLVVRLRDTNRVVLFARMLLFVRR